MSPDNVSNVPLAVFDSVKGDRFRKEGLTRVALYSPQPLMAAGLAEVLKGIGGMTLNIIEGGIQGICGYVLSERPQVCVIELTSDLTIAILTKLHASSRETRLILWVDTIYKEFATLALGAGVCGILRKSDSIEAHVHCFEDILAGKSWLDADLVGRLLSTVQITLSPRQRQMMGLLAQGLKNKEIAWAMAISEGTVKVYMSRLFQRVGVSDRLELALLALRNFSNGAERPDLPEPVAGNRPIALPMPKFVVTRRSNFAGGANLGRKVVGD